MRCLRILRLITRLNVGGPSFQAVLLSHALEGKGFRTLLAAGEPDLLEGDLRGSALASGVRIESIRAMGRRVSPGWDALAFLRILSLIKRWRPDIVHTHLAKAGLLGRLAAAASRVPVRVHTFHGHVFSGYFSPGISAGIIRTERVLSRMTDRIVTVGASVKDEICNRYRIAPADRVDVIPIGIPMAKRVSRSDHLPTVGFVGRLVPVKDPILSVRACSVLRREIPGLILRVAGDGPLRGRMKATAEQLGLGTALELSGWIGSMASFYNGIDLLILTSVNEGTPRSIVEAQAAGIPIVATDVGGVRDLFRIERREGDLEICEEGILVRSRDPHRLAEAARRILREHRVQRRMGEAGRRRVARVHSEERLVAETERLYRDLMARRGRG